MRMMLNFATRLGPRVIIAEVADAETAWAVAAAHTAAGGFASIMEEMPPLSLRDHMRKNRAKRSRAKVIKLKPAQLAPNVTRLLTLKGK